MKPFSLRILALAALTGLCVVVQAAPALVGHKSLASEKIDAATVKAVFLGKKVAWDGAGRVTLAVLKGPIADEFLKGAVEMDFSQFNNYWRRLAMTGGGTAPKFFDKPDDLRRFVAETPGAIGFLDASAADGTVQVIQP